MFLCIILCRDSLAGPTGIATGHHLQMITHVLLKGMQNAAEWALDDTTDTIDPYDTPIQKDVCTDLAPDFLVRQIWKSLQHMVWNTKSLPATLTNSSLSIWFQAGNRIER